MSLSLSDRVARLNDVLVSVNLLNWDARVMMPAGGAETRGHQIATLMGIAREMILDPAMGEAAEAVLASDFADLDRRAALAVQEARAHHARIPAAGRTVDHRRRCLDRSEEGGRFRAVPAASTKHRRSGAGESAGAWL